MSAPAPAGYEPFAPAGHQQAAAVKQQNMTVVVDPRFCLPQQTILVMQEKEAGHPSGAVAITDETGRLLFTSTASSSSHSHDRKLLDAHNMPVVLMQKKLLTMHGTWLIEKPLSGGKLAEVKPSRVPSLTPTVKVFLNDGDKDADLTIMGETHGHEFEIHWFVPGRGNVTVASVQRQSPLPSSATNGSVMNAAPHKHFMTIQPGVDVAFVAALATLCEDIFHAEE